MNESDVAARHEARGRGVQPGDIIKPP
jgi:hypothetical protein